MSTAQPSARARAGGDDTVMTGRGGADALIKTGRAGGFQPWFQLACSADGGWRGRNTERTQSAVVDRFRRGARPESAGESSAQRPSVLQEKCQRKRAVTSLTISSFTRGVRGRLHRPERLCCRV